MVANSTAQEGRAVGARGNRGRARRSRFPLASSRSAGSASERCFHSSRSRSVSYGSRRTGPRLTVRSQRVSRRRLPLLSVRGSAPALLSRAPPLRAAGPPWPVCASPSDRRRGPRGRRPALRGASAGGEGAKGKVAPSVAVDLTWNAGCGEARRQLPRRTRLSRVSLSSNSASADARRVLSQEPSGTRREEEASARPSRLPVAEGKTKGDVVSSFCVSLRLLEASRQYQQQCHTHRSRVWASSADRLNPTASRSSSISSAARHT